MAIVARLLPRHWDGRRLLQFLTGLALIALAFAVPTLQEPADQPAEPPITVITTADARLPAGLPVTEYSATQGAQAAARQAQAAARQAQAAARQAQAGTHASQAGASGRESSGSGATGVTHEATGLPAQAWHGGRRICLERRAAGDGAAQGAHGERGPPGA